MFVKFGYKEKKERWKGMELLGDCPGVVKVSQCLQDLSFISLSGYVPVIGRLVIIGKCR